jgi:hypothetical protein
MSAAQLITFPPIVLLDEPTSGLDSAAAYHVISLIKKVAEHRGITVVATIHQPSSETYQLFNKLMLLANGSTMYFGEPQDAVGYFEGHGFALPFAQNPADYFLNIINCDFMLNREEADARIKTFKANWEGSEQKTKLAEMVKGSAEGAVLPNKVKQNNPFKQFGVLVSRNFRTAYRNPITYWIRIVMYVALALLMGTTWYFPNRCVNQRWKLGNSQRQIEDRLALMFFSVAFLSFMSVAGIPAFLEDRLVYLRETRDNVYKPGPYVLANTIVAIPFIFLVALSFSSVAYVCVWVLMG